VKLPPNHLNVQQHSPEWMQARVGHVTASRVGDVVKRLKSGKYSKERENYKFEKLEELLTGLTSEHYVSVPMQFGIDNEPLARTCYELKREVEVQTVGYFLHPTIKRSGASPDGLVGDDGLIEIKVPNTATHLEYLLAGVIPEEYAPQMMWQMACTGREWCDFVSYDPRLPEDFGLFIIRYQRDAELIAAMEQEVGIFLSELEAVCQKLLQGRPAPKDTGVPKAEIPTLQI
jgi:hypothetical protein